MIRTTTSVLAAVGVCTAIAAPASAAFTSIEANFRGDVEAETSLFGGSGVRDERTIDGFLQYRIDDGIPVGPPSYQGDYNVDSRIGAFGGYGSTNIQTEFAQDYAFFQVTVGGVAVGENDTPGDSRGMFESRGDFGLTINFDDEQDLLIETVLRIEIMGVNGDDVEADAMLSTSGLQGGIVNLDAQENEAPIVREFRNTAISSRGFLGVNGAWQMFLQSEEGTRSIDQLRITAEFRVVPAPAGSAALACAGLLAVRRRR